MLGLHITLDTREFEARMLFAGREAVNAIRSAIDKSARAARKQGLAIAAQDMNVSAARAKKGQPLVKGTGMGRLSASWTINSVAVNAVDVQGVALSKGGGLRMSVERLTGGRSASLNAPKVFQIIGKNSGKKLFMVRTGSGRSAIRAVMGEMAITSMRQDNGAARKAWEKTATEQLTANTTAGIQRVLDGQQASSDRGSD